MELQNKVITVSATASEMKRMTIHDEQKKLYSIFYMVADGSRETKAWASIKNNPVHIGKHYEIAYSEKPNSNKPGTFYRTIATIKEVSANGTMKPSGVHEPTPDMNVRLSRIETDLAYIKAKMGIDTPNTPEKPVESQNESYNTLSQGDEGYINPEDIPFSQS